MMPEPKLTIELVPSTSWYNNVRSHVTPAKWDKLRRECYAKAGAQCEICGAKGRMECHEIWAYDMQTKTQTLTGLICLCHECHQCKHPGLAEVKGHAADVIRHLSRINGWTADEAKAYIRKAFTVWEIRSSYHWTLDLTWLDRKVSQVNTCRS
jgi:hypothetical protein